MMHRSGVRRQSAAAPALSQFKLRSDSQARPSISNGQLEGRACESALQNRGRRFALPPRSIAALLCAFILWAAPTHAAELDFNRDVRPILSENCYTCHGPDANARKAKLRLDSRKGAIAERKHGPAIDIANLSESELIYRITTHDADEVMPPPESKLKLKPKEIALLKQWVLAGGEYAGHWAFETPTRPKLPKLSATNAKWARNPIDHFVAAHLQQKKLKPSPEANRARLLRRVTLDLTGLPPTPAEVDAFLADTRVEAYGKVVDRLLQSPRHGEHMANAWLDAARYADSDGYESDPMRNMWPWRDWVVWALNTNMPFDQFLTEQLAGDLLPKATMRQRLATGFNRNHRINNEGGILPAEWLVENVADRVETTATVFMGLTWGCARCHDHKYDPISQKNYYQLFAFFNTIPETGVGRGASTAKPMMRSPALSQIEAFEKNQSLLDPLQSKLDQMATTQKFNLQFMAWTEKLDVAERKKLPKPIAAVEVKKWTPPQKKIARTHFQKTVHPETTPLQKRLTILTRKRAQLLAGGANVMVMEEMAEPRRTFVLNRGAYDQPGEKVSAKTPAWLPTMGNALPRNRLGLAKWLVNPQHPLTARVTVNRAWAHYFGIGLVKTAEDFGSQGQAPSHPKLLDWLATTFITSGWDVKALHKRIVMSATYRQSSKISPQGLTLDAENRMLARGPRLRLAAAVIRDQALFVSGRLVEQQGGAPVKPYQPDGLWREVIKGGPTYKADIGDKLYRRSLYSLWRRAVKPPLMMLLDANERDTCRVNKKRTNTPLQALLLLNGVTFVEAARGLGTRMIREGGKNAPARVAYGMKLITGRPPTNVEMKILLAELASYRKIYHANPKAAKALVDAGQSQPDDQIAVDELAAYSALGRLLLNLDEAITKE